MKDIILVDDEPLINKIHSMLLRSMNADLILTAFADAELGLKYVKSDPKNKLVLLDINMPVVNAWDFLEDLKEDNISIPVIILSSSINPEDIIRAESYHNVKGFLNKPLNKANIQWLINESGLMTESPSLEA